jgi:hypothetical protein
VPAAYGLDAVVFLLVLLLMSSRNGAFPRQQLGFGAVTAALWAGAANYLVAIAIPYLPGNIEPHLGTVARVFSAQSRNRTCNEYVSIEASGGLKGTICSDRGIFDHTRLTPAPLHVGEAVTVSVKVNILGSAVTALAADATN